MFTGVPTETPEAEPLWTPIDDIPFDLMWEDDRLWLPMLIRGEKFQTRWIFEGDRMVDYHIEPDGQLESWAGGRNV
jgi:8-oxo-dGTP diphosphatase